MHDLIAVTAPSTPDAAWRAALMGTAHPFGVCGASRAEVEQRIAEAIRSAATHSYDPVLLSTPAGFGLAWREPPVTWRVTLLSCNHIGLAEPLPETYTSRQAAADALAAMPGLPPISVTRSSEYEPSLPPLTRLEKAVKVSPIAWRKGGKRVSTTYKATLPLTISDELRGDGPTRDAALAACAAEVCRFWQDDARPAFAHAAGNVLIVWRSNSYKYAIVDDTHSGRVDLLAGSPADHGRDLVWAAGRRHLLDMTWDGRTLESPLLLTDMERANFERSARLQWEIARLMREHHLSADQAQRVAMGYERLTDPQERAA